MIKKILIIIMFIYIFFNIFFYPTTSYGAIITKEANNFELTLYSNVGATINKEEKEKAISTLQKTFGYAGDKLSNGENTMRFRTKIKITEESKINEGKYIIQIGEDKRNNDKEYKPIIMPSNGWFDVVYKKYYSYEQLVSTYGCPEKKNALTVGSTWDVLLIGGGSQDSWTSGSGNHEANQKIVIKATKLYSGKDYNTGEQEQLREGTNFIEVESIGGAIKETIEKAVGKLLMMVLDLFRGLIADGPQMILNSIETSNYSEGIDKIKPWAITYEPEKILQDKNKNLYVNFSENGSNEGSDEQIPKYEEAKSNGFDKETEIPIIPVDLYSIVTGQLEEFDANFFSKPKSKNISEWQKIRNSFASTLVHIVIYLSSAILIGVMIFYGISLVKKSLTPDEKKKYVSRINEFVKSILMLVGSVVIMNLCIYFTNMIFNNLKVSETNEPPIRVILQNEDKIYSFSTNITGYTRYMSSISKVDKIGNKLTYTLFYIVLVWVNIIVVIAMFVRLIVLIILSVLGPVFAVMHSLGKEDSVQKKYQNWIIQYVIWTSIPIVLAIIYKIMLIVAF